MSDKYIPQAQRVLDYIREFGSITQLEAIRDIGVLRLASRVSDLKKKGYRIDAKPENVLNRYGKTSRIKRYSERVEDDGADRSESTV